jgi:transposase-like protein
MPPKKPTTRPRVVTMIKQGQSVREIARKLDISVQRVYQHIDRARELGELPPPERAA